MDLAILGISCSDNREILIQHQTKIYENLLGHFKSEITWSNNITTASVPVLKLKLKPFDQIISVDLLICDQNDIQKVMRLQKANDFVESTLKENKLLKPVILFVKKLLSIHGLLDTYTGGLNSYSLMIMLTAVASQSIGLATSSEYLKEFLNIYRS